MIITFHLLNLMWHWFSSNFQCDVRRILEWFYCLSYKRMMIRNCSRIFGYYSLCVRYTINWRDLKWSTKTFISSSALSHYILSISYQLGLTPLMAAAKDGHLEIVKLLLKSGAIVDAGDHVSCLSVCLFVCLSVCLFVCLSVCLHFLENLISVYISHHQSLHYWCEYHACYYHLYSHNPLFFHFPYLHPCFLQSISLINYQVCSTTGLHQSF